MHSVVRLLLAGAAVFLTTPAPAQNVATLRTATSEDQLPASVLERPAGLVIEDAPLAIALERLGESSGVVVAFSPSLLPLDGRKATCICNGSTVRGALDQILAGTPITYTEVHGNIAVHREASKTPVRLRLAEPVLASNVASLGFVARGTDGVPGRRRTSAAWRVGPGVTAVPPTPRRERVGSIAGVVQDAATRERLDAAQVFLPELDTGTLTDTDGSFLLSNVPAGEHTVRVELLGYQVEERAVSVLDDRTVTVDFTLTRSAIELDQIVVTGTGMEGIERKRLGNTIATIAMPELETAPIMSVSEVLAAREPGLSVMPSSGLSMEGARIRIRGSASLSQSNEPLVYVDGIRINSGGGFAGPVSGGSSGVGASSRLDDIDPNSIARVEVLKGAAAATLYGTEASNGVIQIFTKAGEEGPALWSFQLESGIEVMPTDRVIPFADFPRTQEQADQMNEFWGANLQPFEVLEKDLYPELAETGRLTTFSGSVRGGTAGITYFVSGRYQDHDGIWGMNHLGPMNDESRRIQGTVNLNAFPTDALRLGVRTSYTRTDQSSPQDSNTPFSPHTIMVSSHLRKADEQTPFGEPVFATLRELMQQTTKQEVERFMGSLQASLTPRDNVALNGIIGLDFTSNASEQHLPFGWTVDNFASFDQAGARDVGVQQHTELTAELRGGLENEIGGNWSSSLTLGTQGFLVRTKLNAASGDAFPGPGIEVITAAQNQAASESFSENVNLGIFAQEQLGYREFAFLTIGARYDVNSAFGETFSGVIYPKASLSVIPTELTQWGGSTLSTLRLRAAIGQSGLQPGAFDQFRTYEPLRTTEGPGIQTGNLGNPDLKPEISTEWEAGAEVGLWDDRASAEVTYWNRRVTDALVAKQFPVSGGFRDVQLANIGELSAYGVDIGLNGTVVSSDNLWINLFGNAAYLHERVEDLGGSPPIKVGGSYPRNRNFIMEGFAPGAFFGAKLADAEYPLDIDNNCTEPTREELLEYFSTPRAPEEFEVLPAACGTSEVLLQYLGKPLPDWEGSFGAQINFLGNFRLSSLWEYKIGLQHQDLSGAFRQASASIGQNTPLAARTISTMMNPASTAEERLEAAMTWARELRALDPMSGMNQIWDADFLRWREVSLTYDAPRSLAERFSARSLSVSLRVRNPYLMVNDDYRGLSPELETSARCDSGNLNCNFLLGQETARLPIPRRFTLAIRAGF